MRRALRWIVVAIAAPALARRGSAQCLPAVCSLTLTLQSDASGISLGGPGTNFANVSFGTISAFTGDRTHGRHAHFEPDELDAEHSVRCEVTCSNLLTLLSCTLLLTPTFTLTAQLQSSDLAHLVGGQRGAVLNGSAVAGRSLCSVFP